MIKIVNRNIKFDTAERLESSSYKCEYKNRNSFEILRININYETECRTYEIESRHLKPSTKSIHFDAIKTEDSFEIKWSPKIIESYMKRIK